MSEKVGRKRKEIPYEIKRQMKRRRFDNIRETQAWLKGHNVDVSIGWLSVHKDEWMPTRPEQREANFIEEDKTFDTDMATRIMHLKGINPEFFNETKHFTREQLLKFSEKTVEGCAAFSKECLSWKGKPVELQDYQRQMIEGWLTRRSCTYPIGRGGGKDFTMAIFLIWLCTTQPNMRIMVVCPASRQVKTFINENLHMMIHTSGNLYDSVQKMIEEEFWFTNNSVIFTYGATSYIKGKHNLDYIFANEAAEIPDNVYENVLIPMLGTARGGGHFNLIGVPEGQVGYFWKSFNDSTDKIDDLSSNFFNINLPTSVNKFYDKKQLELNRQMMSEESYLQEHMAKFLDIEGALFTQKLIDKIKVDYEPAFGMVDHKNFEYYLGIDWGRTAAYSVFTIIAREKSSDIARVEWMEPSHDDFPTQVAWIVAADEIYKFKVIMSEYMGIGIPPSDQLKSILGSSKVKFFTPSAEKWFEAFTLLRDRAENDLLEVPAGELKLLSQLRLLAFVMRANKLTVRSEGKDDYSQSLCMGNYGIKKKGGAGVAGAI